MARLGLTANPFRLRGGAALRAALIDPALPERVAAWVAETSAVVEFVGPRGAGKSTHLALLAEVVGEQRGARWTQHYVPPGEDGLPSPPRGGWWCIDEAQRVASRRLRRIIAQAGRGRFRLALGTHVSVAPLCAALGVACRSAALPPADADAQRLFVERRFAADGVMGASAPQLSAAALARLVAAAGGNLRTVEEIMYEVVQAAASAGAWPATFEVAHIERAIAAQRWVVYARS